ncbi:MAG: NUDIX domain-containing protein [Candidatus Pacearchaeota archaeon]|jgi:8-oxo-dGTP diphosphatase
MIKIRRKGVAIVETPRGILMVAGKDRKFTLPGGGANNGENREVAAIRELYEETGLRTKSSKYLFSCIGHKWRTLTGRKVVNYCKVFLIKTSGKPKAGNEIKHLAFWKPGSKITISPRTKKIIEKYNNAYK